MGIAECVQNVLQTFSPDIQDALVKVSFYYYYFYLIELLFIGHFIK